jgi:putative transposase
VGRIIIGFFIVDCVILNSPIRAIGVRMNSIMMDKDRLDELDTKLAKGVKTEADLPDPLDQLMKLTIDKALNAEMETILVMRNILAKVTTKKIVVMDNSKKIKTDSGDLEIETPLDRDSEFEPSFVKKGQRRLLGFDPKILTLNTKAKPPEISQKPSKNYVALMSLIL